MPNTREKLIKIVKDTNTELERRHYMVVSIADRIIASGFIEELQNEGYDMGVDSALHNHFGLSWEDAAGLRKEIKRLQEAARWIPVTERLPQEDEPLGATCEQVQVLLDNGVVSTGWCNRVLKVWWHLNYGETHFIGYDYERTPVIAWQPLSQPPKEG